jgi:ribosomal protein S9
VRIITFARRKSCRVELKLFPQVQITESTVNGRALFLESKFRKLKDLILELGLKEGFSATTSGGGVSGQTDALILALLKAKLKASDDIAEAIALKTRFKAYDAGALKSNPTKVQSKKPQGTKARKRRRKSYR